MMQAILATLRVDGLRLRRDRFLVGALVYVILIAASLRWLVPWLTHQFQDRVDLTPYLPLAGSYFAATNGALIVGVVGGFLLLESREEEVSLATAVAPIPRWLPFAALATALAVAGALMVLLLGLLAGLALPPWPALLAASVLAAPTASIVAGLVAATASNKVEAFAVLKGINLLGLLPVLAWFLAVPWEYAVGLTPFYWSAKLWWLAEAGEAWGWAFGLGMGVQLLWCLGLGTWLARRQTAPAS